MTNRDLVRAAAYVALCKEWFGGGAAGREGAYNAAQAAEDPERKDVFESIWSRANAIADTVPRDDEPTRKVGK